MISPVVAPLSRAALSASPVALVPPSWEIAMQTPPGRGSRAASRAWRASARAEARPARRNASVSSSATTMAACSEVPQPVTTTGSPVGGRAEDGVAQPRHLGTIGAEDRRRELRLREDHLLHHPRRSITQFGEVVGQPVAVLAGHGAPPDRGSFPGVIAFPAGGVITIMKTRRGRVPWLP